MAQAATASLDDDVDDARARELVTFARRDDEDDATRFVEACFGTGATARDGQRDDEELCGANGDDAEKVQSQSQRPLRFAVTAALDRARRVALLPPDCSAGLSERGASGRTVTYLEAAISRRPNNGSIDCRVSFVTRYSPTVRFFSRGAIYLKRFGPRSSSSRDHAPNPTEF